MLGSDFLWPMFYGSVQSEPDPVLKKLRSFQSVSGRSDPINSRQVRHLEMFSREVVSTLEGWNALLTLYCGMIPCSTSAVIGLRRDSFNANAKIIKLKLSTGRVIEYKKKRAQCSIKSLLTINILAWGCFMFYGCIQYRLRGKRSQGSINIK